MAAAQLPILEPESTELKANSITIVHPLYNFYSKDLETLFNFDVLNSSFAKLDNIKANCTFYFFNHTGNILINDTLLYNSSTKLWYYKISSANITSENDYSFYVHCFSNENEKGFLMEAFEVSALGSGPKNPTLFGFIILIPMIIGAFFLFISWLLPTEHWALKLIIPILTLTFVWESYQYSIIVIAKFFNAPEIIDAIGDNTYKFTIIWIVALFVVICAALWYGTTELMTKKIIKKPHKTGDYEDEQR